MLPTAQPKAPTLQQILGEPSVEWQRPALVTETIRHQAGAALAQWSERYAPAPDQAKRDWLVKLGLLVAGTMTEADARVKSAALIDVIDHPSGCFTKHSLRRAAERFKFWPSFAELKELLDEELRRQRVFEIRLRALLAPPQQAIAPKPAGKQWADMNAEERAEHDRLLAGMRAELAKEAPAIQRQADSRDVETRGAYERVTAGIAQRRQQQDGGDHANPT